jgi:hypothetical protein
MPCHASAHSVHALYLFYSGRTSFIPRPNLIFFSLSILLRIYKLVPNFMYFKIRYPSQGQTLTLA